VATADAHFSIGKTHRVCEDYARAGLLPDGRAFAIVSDGCSSSPDTDFGSRLMTIAAQERMMLSGDFFEPSGVVWQALSAARGMRLPHTCLDATLMTLFQKANGDVRAFLVGDGALAARRRTGEIEIWRMLFLPGESGLVAPGYLTYTLEKERLDRYIDQGYNSWAMYRTLDGVHQDTETGDVSYRIGEDGTLSPQGFWRVVDFPAQEYDFVMVCSDGVESFQKKVAPGTFEPVPFLEVMSHMTAMKSLKGPFVTKRMKRFLERAVPRLEWQHYDDVAAAGITLTEPVEQS